MCPLNKKFLQKLSMIFLKNIELLYFDQKKKRKVFCGNHYISRIMGMTPQYSQYPKYFKIINHTHLLKKDILKNLTWKVTKTLISFYKISFINLFHFTFILYILRRLVTKRAYWILIKIMIIFFWNPRFIKVITPTHLHDRRNKHTFY